MLEITVGATENFDEVNNLFARAGGDKILLEHSLVSLSKWESKYEKPFLGQSDRTPEEMLFYIQCMLLSENPPEDFLDKMSEENFEAIHKHINAKMTATTFYEAPGAPKNKETITSELVYYWMTVFSIPFTCETWHLSRLLTLVRICNLKQGKQKKMSKADAARQQRELNEQRRKQLNSAG